MSDLSKAVDLVRQARMDSWQRMAKELPDHHVLAVEMFRVDRNTTVSIFTLVRRGRVVQEVLQGDGRGLGVKPVVPRTTVPCSPINLGREFHIDALMAPIAPAAITDDGPPRVHPPRAVEPFGRPHRRASMPGCRRQAAARPGPTQARSGCNSARQCELRVWADRYGSVPGDPRQRTVRLCDRPRACAGPDLWSTSPPVGRPHGRRQRATLAPATDRH